MADPFVTGLVLAAGGSSRLGRPKQLLPYGEGTLLEHVLAIACASPLDQLIVAVGGSSDEVLARVDMRGAEVVVNDSYGEGCSSSIAASLPLVDPACDVLVLMLGDQPGVTAASVCALVQGRGDAPVAVCRYDDGRGHPFAFGRTVFGGLAGLHGDKAVWKLLEQRPELVREVRMPGRVPPDVDTWDDYDAVLSTG
ncbi:MAG TPA: nucleotidyltransferase family protein [Thermoleophilaceae bacterium]